MSLINYVEPASGGEVLVGIGIMVLFLVFSWIFYRLYNKVCVWFDSAINRDEKYNLLEEVMLDKMAKEKGIDLNKELMERNFLRQPKESKSIRKKIKDKVYEDFFGKEETSVKK